MGFMKRVCSCTLTIICISRYIKSHPSPLGYGIFFFKNCLADFLKMFPGFLGSVRQSVSHCNPFLNRPQVLGLFFCIRCGTSRTTGHTFLPYPITYLYSFIQQLVIYIYFVLLEIYIKMIRSYSLFNFRHNYFWFLLINWVWGKKMISLSLSSKRKRHGEWKFLTCDVIKKQVILLELRTYKYKLYAFITHIISL